MDICTLKFDGKEIPVTYDETKIGSRLAETTLMIEKATEYFKNNQPTQQVIDEAIAEEVISSSFIEGYEVYFRASDLAEMDITKLRGSKADRAVICGHRAYKHLLSSNVETPNTKEGLKDIWRKLIKYKPYLTNFRVTGVRVGNRVHTVHVAPDAKYVRNLLDNMYTEALPKFSDNAVLQSIIFHYLFTFIHPFIDGNGRIARLIEQSMLMKHYSLNMCIPISSAILQDKRLYYRAFNSGQKFGNDHLDVLSIDITDFINNNCRFISQGIQQILVRNGYENDVELPEALDFSAKPYQVYTRDEVIDICGGLDIYYELLCTGKVREMDFGFMYSKTTGRRFF